MSLNVDQICNIPTKTLQNGFSMPVYGMGLWKVGGRKTRDTVDDAKNIDAIKFAIERGVRHFDTAESYGDGGSEEVLGQAMDGVDRKKLFISTKVAAHNQGYEGTKDALRKSLDRLKTNYVDLYILHRYPMPGISIEDTMRALDDLKSASLIKNIGVSNMTPRRFDEAQKYSENKITYNQVHYNVMYREVEKYGLLEHALKNDYLLAAWRPIQNAELPDSDMITELARKYNKSAKQIAINWLISQDNVVTLSKTTSPDHLEENLGALNFTMEESDIERIRLEFPDQQMVSDVVPLNHAADIGEV